MVESVRGADRITYISQHVLMADRGGRDERERECFPETWSERECALKLKCICEDISLPAENTVSMYGAMHTISLPFPLHTWRYSWESGYCVYVRSLPLVFNFHYSGGESKEKFSASEKVPPYDVQRSSFSKANPMEKQLVHPQTVYFL